MEFAKEGRSGNLIGVLLRIVASAILLGLVAAIIFPVFAQRGGGGRAPSSMSSLKQIGLAEMQYIQDYDERLPARQYGSGASIYSWRVALQPYLKAHNPPKTADDDIFAATDDAAGNLPDVEGDGFHRSFAVNSTSGSTTIGPFSDELGGRMTLAKMDAPAATICFVESTSAFNDFDVLAPAQFTSATSSRYSAGHLFTRKGLAGTSITNICFGDCHVKAVDPTSTLDTTGVRYQWGIVDVPMSPAEVATATAVINFGVTHSDADRQIPTRERTFWQKMSGATR